MTNTHAQSKKRHWRGTGAGGAFRFVSARDPMAFLSKYRSSFGRGGSSGNENAAMDAVNQTVLSIDGYMVNLLMGKDGGVDYDVAMEEEEVERVPEKVSLAQALPQELMELVLSLLDGKSLLACSLVCRTIAQLTYDRGVWRNICMKQWPTLQTQFLPQLPGAPDYDVRFVFSQSGHMRYAIVTDHQQNRLLSSSFDCTAAAGAAASWSSTARTSALSCACRFRTSRR